MNFVMIVRWTLEGHRIQNLMTSSFLLSCCPSELGHHPPAPLPWVYCIEMYIHINIHHLTYSDPEDIYSVHLRNVGNTAHNHTVQRSKVRTNTKI
jgi:hypothetical protein